MARFLVGLICGIEGTSAAVLYCRRRKRTEATARSSPVYGSAEHIYDTVNLTFKTSRDGCPSSNTADKKPNLKLNENVAYCTSNMAGKKSDMNLQENVAYCQTMSKK